MLVPTFKLQLAYFNSLRYSTINVIDVGSGKITIGTGDLEDYLLAVKRDCKVLGQISDLLKLNCCFIVVGWFFL